MKRQRVNVRCAANCIPLLIQQKVREFDGFNRSWEEYKVGFNDTRGNYWLGNDLLSQLTANGRYKLRFDLQLLTNRSWYWAEYSSFVVYSEATNYTLLVSGYSGNIGDALSHYDNNMFSTYDRDNNPWGDNCAAVIGGGFWYNGYNSCGRCRVNGHYYNFYWRQPNVNNQFYNHHLHRSRMWLTC